MASVETILAQHWPHDLTGTDVATCALIHFYVHEEGLNHTGPLLTRILTFITRLILHVDATPENLDQFIRLLDACMRGDVAQDDDDRSLDDARIRSIVQHVCQSLEEITSFSGLHNFFARVERLLLRDEMFDDIQNVTILPAERQIDEASPFGQFLHLCLEHYLCLEDDEFGKLVGRVESWVKSEKHTDATSSYDQYLPVEEEIQLFLRQGDYASARSLLQGSFDRAPAAMLGRTLPDTLLQNAAFHVKTKAYEAAKESLEEALRLARGINNVSCIARCDALYRQIEFEQQMMTKRPLLSRPRTEPSKRAPVKYANQIDALRHLDQGYPLISVIQGVEKLLSSMRKKGGGQSTDAQSHTDTIRQLDVLLASFWSTLGSETNSQVLQDCGSDDVISTIGWTTREQDARLLFLQAKRFSLAGQHVAALSTILDKEILCTMDVDILQDWHGELLRIMFRAAMACGATDTMGALVNLRPEVSREVGGPTLENDPDYTLADKGVKGKKRFNEASFMRSERVTIEEALLLKINKAHEYRTKVNHPAQCLTMAVEAMNESEEACLFVIYRTACLEVCEALLAMGQVARSQSTLESITPQLLSGEQGCHSAQAAWLYARILLAQTKGKSEGDRNDRLTASEVSGDFRAALAWLDRAVKGFSAASMWPELMQVYYVKARVCHSLGMLDERDKAAAAHKEVVEEMRCSTEQQHALLDRVQQVAGLASARVIAGG